MDIKALLKSNSSIYQTHIPDKDLVFHYRLLTLKEYKVFKGLRDNGIITPIKLHEEVFELCFLGEIAFLSDELPAGITSSIGQLIMYLSGDCEHDKEVVIQTLLANRAQEPIGTLHNYMLGVITKIFPTYSYEDIVGWTRDELYKRFVIAENILKARDPEYKVINTEDISFGNEKTKQNKNNQNINFDKENAAIRANTNPWDNMEAEGEMNKLSKEQLKRLDSRKRG
jgi:hypothetical protein